MSTNSREKKIQLCWYLYYVLCIHFYEYIVNFILKYYVPNTKNFKHTFKKNARNTSHYGHS